MDYKQKYNEALERARKINKEFPTICGINMCEYIFPELKESEDEKMWKLIKKYARVNISDMALDADHITREELVTWLEKQGKYKVWTDNDYDRVKSIEYLLHELDNHNFDDWFNSLKK